MRGFIRAADYKMVSDSLQAYDLFSRVFETNDLFILLIYT